MRVGASRCALRHERRAYGSQQAGKLSNALAGEKGTLSGADFLYLLPNLEFVLLTQSAIRLVSLANKGGVGGMKINFSKILARSDGGNARGPNGHHDYWA